MCAPRAQDGENCLRTSAPRQWPQLAMAKLPAPAPPPQECFKPGTCGKPSADGRKLSNYIERVLSAHAEEELPADKSPEQAKRLKRT